MCRALRRSVGAAVVLWALAGGAAALGDSPSVYLNDTATHGSMPPVSIGGGPGLVHAKPGEDLFSEHFLSSLSWTGWGGVEPTATGEVSLLIPDSPAFSPVTVTLGGLTDCDGVSIYTRYALAVPAGARLPEGWEWERSLSLPCLVSADGFYPNDPSVRAAYRRGDCTPASLAGTNDEHFTPRLPRSALYAGFCRMRWTGWGTGSASGVGVFRDGILQWGVAAVMSRPEFCGLPGEAEGGGTPLNLGVNYTSLTIKLYGRGKPEPTRPPYGVSVSEAAQLTRSISRGHASQTFHQSSPASEGCFPA
jgi:hypothetical protein